MAMRLIAMFDTSSASSTKPPSTASPSACSMVLVVQTVCLACAVANISPEWLQAISKAKDAVKNLTLEDKVNLGTGLCRMHFVFHITE